MTAEIERLVLEHLRAIRATQADHGERLTSIELHLVTLGQQVGALTTAVYSDNPTLTDCGGPVEPESQGPQVSRWRSIASLSAS